MPKNKPNEFSEKFGLKSPPIIQAPMAGGVTTPELVAAVSNAGGLGTFATGYLNPDEVLSGVRKIKSLTDKPFAVNLLLADKPVHDTSAVEDYKIALEKYRKELNMPPNSDHAIPAAPKDTMLEVIEIALQENVPIVSFAFGILPNTTIERLKGADVYLIGTATSLEEAKLLESAGIDAIVAQGVEAGGHRGGFKTPAGQASVGGIALIPRIVESVKIPVIAAGGIMNGRGILAAISLGAAAAQLGTAFIATKESGANPTYKQQLGELRKVDYDRTVLTQAYSGKHARGIETGFVRHMESALSAFPPYPTANALSGPVRKEAAKQKAPHIMSLWSGQGGPLIRGGVPAFAFMQQLQAEVRQCLEELSQLNLGASSDEQARNFGSKL